MITRLQQLTNRDRLIYIYNTKGSAAALKYMEHIVENMNIHKKAPVIPLKLSQKQEVIDD